MGGRPLCPDLSLASKHLSQSSKPLLRQNLSKQQNRPFPEHSILVCGFYQFHSFYSSFYARLLFSWCDFSTIFPFVYFLGEHFSITLIQFSRPMLVWVSLRLQVTFCGKSSLRSLPARICKRKFIHTRLLNNAFFQWRRHKCAVSSFSQFELQWI